MNEGQQDSMVLLAEYTAAILFCNMLFSKSREVAFS